MCRELAEGDFDLSFYPYTILNNLNTRGFKISKKFFGKYQLRQIYRGRKRKVMLSRGDVELIIHNYNTYDKVKGIFKTPLIITHDTPAPVEDLSELPQPASRKKKFVHFQTTVTESVK